MELQDTEMNGMKPCRILITKSKKSYFKYENCKNYA
jgi:hypothetical protein